MHHKRNKPGTSKRSNRRDDRSIMTEFVVSKNGLCKPRVYLRLGDEPRSTGSFVANIKKATKFPHRNQASKALRHCDAEDYECPSIETIQETTP